MKIGSLNLLCFLACGSTLYATEPRKVEIERINECAFLSDGSLVYTTSKGDLGIWNITEKKAIRRISCNDSGAWLCGVASDILVVQASGSTFGFSTRELKNLYKIPVNERILLTAVCLKTQRIAVYDQSGCLSIASLVNGKVLRQFNVGQLEYAQAWLRLEFSEKGDQLFMFLHSIRRKEHTTTKIINVDDGRLIYSRSNWHRYCKESICDATLQLKNPAKILAATRTKGVFECLTESGEIKELLRDPGIVYKIQDVSTGHLQLILTFSEDFALRVYDLNDRKLLDTVRLPKGYVRSWATSESRKELALVVLGEDGDNLILVDLSRYAQKH